MCDDEIKKGCIVARLFFQTYSPRFKCTKKNHKKFCIRWNVRFFTFLNKWTVSFVKSPFLPNFIYDGKKKKSTKSDRPRCELNNGLILFFCELSFLAFFGKKRNRPKIRNKLLADTYFIIFSEEKKIYTVKKYLHSSQSLKH